MELLHATTFDGPFSHALTSTKEALVCQGFSIMTQVDLRAALEAETDAQPEPNVILGAYVPEVIADALDADPSAALMLMFWVVVRSADGIVTVETYNPAALSSANDHAALDASLEALRERLDGALRDLHGR